MKTIIKLTKSITALLIMLMMLQSCTVYKRGNIRLEQVVQNENKVKIEMSSNEKLKFKKVVLEKGDYYGIKKIKGKNKRVPIDMEQIMGIKEKDNFTSVLGTVGTVLLATIGILALVAVIGGGFM